MFGVCEGGGVAGEVVDVLELERVVCGEAEVVAGTTAVG